VPPRQKFLQRIRRPNRLSCCAQFADARAKLPAMQLPWISGGMTEDNPSYAPALR